MEAEREATQQFSSPTREQDIGSVGKKRGTHCKAQSAMRGPQRAPQMRSTATALAVALSEKHNLGHEKYPLGQSARTDA